MRERWSHQDSSSPQTPCERCCQPSVADPDLSYIEVKINSPDSTVCLSEDDGLHTFLLCTQVPRLLLRPSPPFPSLFFITFILSFPSPSSSCILSVWLALSYSAVLFGKRSCLLNDKRMKACSRTCSSLIPRSLSFPLMARQTRLPRHRNRTFRKYKVNRTMRGLKKTPDTLTTEHE